jgi:hypothetical protein
MGDSIQNSAISAALSEPVYASMMERFGACLRACLLDSLLISAVVRLIDVVVMVTQAPWSPSIAYLFIGYRFLAHSLTGTTVGKYIVGIEVVQVSEGEMPRFIAMFMRDTVGFLISISFSLFGMGYWWGSLSRSGRAWSNNIGGTLVQERETDPNQEIGFRSRTWSRGCRRLLALFPTSRASLILKYRLTVKNDGWGVGLLPVCDQSATMPGTAHHF